MNRDKRLVDLAVVYAIQARLRMTCGGCGIPITTIEHRPNCPGPEWILLEPKDQVIVFPDDLTLPTIELLCERIEETFWISFGSADTTTSWRHEVQVSLGWPGSAVSMWVTPEFLVGVTDRLTLAPEGIAYSILHRLGRVPTPDSVRPESPPTPGQPPTQ